MAKGNVIAATLAGLAMLAGATANTQNATALAGGVYSDCVKRLAALNLKYHAGNSRAEGDKIVCGCLAGAGVSSRVFGAQGDDASLSAINDACQALRPTE